jgi:hypothetical protein
MTRKTDREKPNEVVRTTAFLHTTISPETKAKLNALMEPLECWSLRGVLEKIIRAKYDAVFSSSNAVRTDVVGELSAQSGKDKPPADIVQPTSLPGPATSGSPLVRPEAPSPVSAAPAQKRRTSQRPSPSAHAAKAPSKKHST